MNTSMWWLIRGDKYQQKKCERGKEKNSRKSFLNSVDESHFKTQ